VTAALCMQTGHLWAMPLHLLTCHVSYPVLCVHVFPGKSCACLHRQLPTKWCCAVLLVLCAAAAGYSDPDRAAVIGGSHGGFLTGHLMGQHPERFR
jgi:hypothetical protein